jgi:GNAT superfamily N-acetyltransferase
MKIPRQFSFWTVLSRLTKPFLDAYHVFEFDLSQQRPCLPVKPDFRISLYRGAKDLRTAIDVLVPVGLSPTDISARFERGDLVAVGVLREQTAAYTWASFSEASVKELGITVLARAGEVFQYDTLVLKPFRRHGLQFALAQSVLDYAQRHGYTRTLSWVNVMNRPSCKNQWKWGKKVLLTAVLLKVPGTRYRWTFSLGAPLNSVFTKMRLHNVSAEVEANSVTYSRP